MNAKEADLKFRECYGRDGITGINNNYQLFVPDTLKDKIIELKSIIETSKNFVIDRKYVLDEIEDLTSAYETIANTNPGPRVIVSRNMSSIVLGCSHIYDYEMCNFITPDVVRINGEKPISSRFTKVVYDAISLNDDVVFGPLTSLINTIIEYFDPNIVASVLRICIIKDSKSVYFTKERIRGYYEALMNRENVIYANRYIPIAESVGYIYYKTTYTNVMDTITDKHGVYSLIAMGTSNVYGDSFKDTITQDIFNEITADVSGAKDSEFVTVLRYLKDQVVEWVKHKNLDERPECPEAFKYINMNLFMSNLYTAGIHILGNSKQILDKFDTEIEQLDIDIYEGKYKKLDENAKEGDRTDNEERAKNRLESFKKRRKDYLRLKSSISFLFVEILSNEKLALKVFDEDLVAMIILQEPPFDFGMNDVNSNVASTFIKRDFKPVQSVSINPYYVHFGEQELSTDNAKYLASVLSSLVHPNMRSAVALAGAYNFENLENIVNSLKYHYINSVEIFNNFVKGQIKRIEGFYNQYKPQFELPETIKPIFESGLDIDKLIKIDEIISDYFKNTTSTDDDTEFAKYKDSENLFCTAATEVKSMRDWIDNCKDTTNNILGQVDFVVGNITNDNVINSSIVSVKENKPVKDFWPLTQSYEFEIENDDNAVQNFDDPLKPGDIMHHRYGSRYKGTDPD